MDSLKDKNKEDLIKSIRFNNARIKELEHDRKEMLNEKFEDDEAKLEKYNEILKKFKQLKKRSPDKPLAKKSRC